MLYRTSHPLLALALAVLLPWWLAACTDSDRRKPTLPEPPPTVTPPEPTYEAEILWTDYGVPHVSAQDWGSAGYGVWLCLRPGELLCGDEGVCARRR